MKKEEILKKHTQGFELFPMTPGDEREMLFSMIYSAMDDYAESKKNKQNDALIKEEKGIITIFCPGDVILKTGTEFQELIDHQVNIVSNADIEKLKKLKS